MPTYIQCATEGCTIQIAAQEIAHLPKPWYCEKHREHQVFEDKPRERVDLNCPDCVNRNLPKTMAKGNCVDEIICTCCGRCWHSLHFIEQYTGLSTPNPDYKKPTPTEPRTDRGAFVALCSECDLDIYTMHVSYQMGTNFWHSNCLLKRFEREGTGGKSAAIVGKPTPKLTIQQEANLDQAAFTWIQDMKAAGVSIYSAQEGIACQVMEKALTAAWLDGRADVREVRQALEEINPFLKALYAADTVEMERTLGVINRAREKFKL